jgi:hypothetical protein
VILAAHQIQVAFLEHQTQQILWAEQENLEDQKDQTPAEQVPVVEQDQEQKAELAEEQVGLTQTQKIVAAGDGKLHITKGDYNG